MVKCAPGDTNVTPIKREGAQNGMERNKTKQAQKRTRKRGRNENGAGTLVKHGKFWHARWWVNGKKISRSTGTEDLEQAKEWLEKQSVVRTGLRDREALAKISLAISASLEDVETSRRVVGVPVAQLFELYRDAPNRADVKEATLDGYRHQFNMLAAWLQERFPEITSARDISQTVADEYISDRMKAVSAARVNKDLNLFSLAWRTLAKKYGLEYDPWSVDHIARKRHQPHERRALTDEEVNALLDNSEGEMRLMFLIAICTGLRMGDILNLRWEEHVDLEARKIALRRTRKTGAPIVLPIVAELSSALQAQKNANPGEPWVLPWEHGRPIRDICRSVARVFKRAGIEMHPENEDGNKSRSPTASFHSLRHTFVTRLMRRGISPALIQAAVGHSTMLMTEHYTHISADDLARGLADERSGESAASPTKKKPRRG